MGKTKQRRGVRLAGRGGRSLHEQKLHSILRAYRKRKPEQYYNMKFCFKFRKATKEILEIIKQVYRDAAMTLLSVFFS